jgi:hypothetical protein
MKLKSIAMSFKFYNKIKSHVSNGNSGKNLDYFMKVIKNILINNYAFNFNTSDKGICTITRCANSVFFNKITIKIHDQFITIGFNGNKFLKSAIAEDNILYNEIRKRGGDVYNGNIWYSDIDVDLYDAIIKQVIISCRGVIKGSVNVSGKNIGTRTTIDILGGLITINTVYGDQDKVLTFYITSPRHSIVDINNTMILLCELVETEDNKQRENGIQPVAPPPY